MSLIFDHPRQVARHFGRNIRTIQRWIRAGMPQLSGGLFDVDEIEIWLQNQRAPIELQARPRGVEYLDHQVPAEVQSLFGAGIGGMRQGLKTLFRALVMGGYRGDVARKVTLQLLIDLFLEEFSGI